MSIRMADRRTAEEAGFTMIELMVVVLIIGILLSIALPSFLGARDRAENRAPETGLVNSLLAAKAEYVEAKTYTTVDFTLMTAAEPALQYVQGTDASTGPDVVSLDWRVPLDVGWGRIGFDRGIQGNLDPVRTVAGWEVARAGMLEVLASAGGRPGHVFNLGHGVLPDTDPDVLRRLVDTVHTETATA